MGYLVGPPWIVFWDINPSNLREDHDFLTRLEATTIKTLREEGQSFKRRIPLEFFFIIFYSFSSFVMTSIIIAMNFMVFLFSIIE